MKLKNIISTILITSLLSSSPNWAQDTESKDTVIINFGSKSKIIFFINDKGDLESLEQYDLNAIAKDLKERIEQEDYLETDSTVSNDQFSDRF